MLDLDWTDLESHVTADGVFNPPAKRSAGIDAKVVKFPCQKCFGSGQFRGMGKCFACGGKGHFLTSERDRANARQGAATRKATKLNDAREVFEAQNPGVAAFLASAAKWSTFAAELTGKLAQYGALTDGQLRAVRSMQSKCAAREEARATERKAGAATIDLAPIRAMFDAAVKNGKREPIYRAAGLVISAAKPNSANPGALYVKTVEGEYLGKLLGTAYQGKPAPALATIAADPRAEAVKFGKATGRCSCCGATLTNGKSIELGIGPICAEKWGL